MKNYIIILISFAVILIVVKITLKYFYIYSTIQKISKIQNLEELNNTVITRRGTSGYIILKDFALKKIALKRLNCNNYRQVTITNYDLIKDEVSRGKIKYDSLQKLIFNKLEKFNKINVLGMNSLGDNGSIAFFLDENTVLRCIYDYDIYIKKTKLKEKKFKQIGNKKYIIEKE